MKQKIRGATEGNISLHKITSNSVFHRELKETQSTLDQILNQHRRFMVTLRELLSTFNDLVDLLGFIAPLFIMGRILASNICSTEAVWDDN